MALRHVRDVVSAVVPTVVAVGGYYYFQKAAPTSAEYDFRFEYDPFESLCSNATLANTAAPSNAEYGYTAFNTISENNVNGKTITGTELLTNSTSPTEDIPLSLVLLIAVLATLALAGGLLCITIATCAPRVIGCVRAKAFCTWQALPVSWRNYAFRVCYWWCNDYVVIAATLLACFISTEDNYEANTAAIRLLSALLLSLIPRRPTRDLNAPKHSPDQDHGGEGPSPKHGSGPNGGKCPDATSKSPSSNQPQPSPASPHVPDTTSPVDSDESERWLDAPERPANDEDAPDDIVDNDEQWFDAMESLPVTDTEPEVSQSKLIIKKKKISVEVIRHRNHVLVRHGVPTPHQILPRIAFRQYAMAQQRAMSLIDSENTSTARPVEAEARVQPSGELVLSQQRPDANGPRETQLPGDRLRDLRITIKCLQAGFKIDLAAKQDIHNAAMKTVTEYHDAATAKLEEVHKDAVKELTEFHDASVAELEDAHEVVVKEMTESHDATKAELTAMNETNTHHQQRVKELEAKLSQSDKEMAAGWKAYDRAKRWCSDESKRSASHFADAERLAASYARLLGELNSSKEQTKQAQEDAIQQRLRAEALEKTADDNKRTVVNSQETNMSHQEHIDTLQAQLRESKEQVNKLLGELNNSERQANKLRGELSQSVRSKKSATDALNRHKEFVKTAVKERDELRAAQKQPGPSSTALDQTPMVDAAVQTEGPEENGSAPPENGQDKPSESTATPAPGPPPSSTPSLLREPGEDDAARPTDISTTKVFTFSGIGQSEPPKPSPAALAARPVAPVLPALSKPGDHRASVEAHGGSMSGDPASESEDDGPKNTPQEIASRIKKLPVSRIQKMANLAPAPASPILSKPGQIDAAGETNDKSTKDVVVLENSTRKPPGQIGSIKPPTIRRQRPIDSPLRDPRKPKPAWKVAPPRPAQTVDLRQNKLAVSNSLAPAGGNEMDGVEKAPSQPAPFGVPTPSFGFTPRPGSKLLLPPMSPAAGMDPVVPPSSKNDGGNGPKTLLLPKSGPKTQISIFRGKHVTMSATSSTKPDVEMDDVANDSPIPSQIDTTGSRALHQQTSKGAAAKPQSMVENQIKRLEERLATLTRKRNSMALELDGYTQGHSDTAPGELKNQFLASMIDAKKILENLDKQIAEVKEKLEKLKRHAASQHTGGGHGKGDDDDGDDGPDDGGFPGSGNSGRGNTTDMDDSGNRVISRENGQSSPSDHPKTGSASTNAQDQDMSDVNMQPVVSTVPANSVPVQTAFLHPSPSGSRDRPAPLPSSLAPAVRRSGQSLYAMNDGGMGMGSGGTTKLFRRPQRESSGPLVRPSVFPQPPQPSGHPGPGSLNPDGSASGDGGASMPTKRSNSTENALPALFAGMKEKIKRFNEIQKRLDELKKRQSKIEGEIDDADLEADLANVEQDASLLESSEETLKGLKKESSKVNKEIAKLEAEERALNGQPKKPDSNSTGDDSEETDHDDEGYDSENGGSGTRSPPSKPAQHGGHRPIKPMRRRRQAGPPPAPDATVAPTQQPITGTPFEGLPESESQMKQRLEGELETKNEELKTVNAMIAVLVDFYDTAIETENTQEAAGYKQQISDKKSARDILKQDIETAQKQLEVLKKAMDE